jgi:hypothetical protein
MKKMKFADLLFYWMKQNKIKLFSDVINYYKEQINLYENIIQKLEQVRIKL